MDIEITTTKKRLTQSIINQMLFINGADILDAECLGFVSTTKGLFLLYHTGTGQYKKTYYHWYVSISDTDTLYIKIGRYSSKMVLENTEQAKSVMSKIKTDRAKVEQIYF